MLIWAQAWSDRTQETTWQAFGPDPLRRGCVCRQRAEDLGFTVRSPTPHFSSCARTPDSQRHATSDVHAHAPGRGRRHHQAVLLPTGRRAGCRGVLRRHTYPSRKSSVLTKGRLRWHGRPNGAAPPRPLRRRRTALVDACGASAVTSPRATGTSSSVDGCQAHRLYAHTDGCAHRGRRADRRERAPEQDLLVGARFASPRRNRPWLAGGASRSLAAAVADR